MSFLRFLAQYSGWIELLIYVLGVTAGGLLLVPWQQRDRVIPGILSVLWLWMALYRYIHPPVEPPWLSWLAVGSLVLQALIFFGVGVVAGRLRFDSYAGPWPVFGGILILSSLVAHPLLRAFGQGHDSGATNIPFPPLVLTWGLLLFCRSRLESRFSKMTTWVVGVIPLLWAGLGPPDPQPIVPAQSWALWLVFILGFFFMALPEDLWRESRWWPDRRMLYELCREQRKHLGGSLFLLLIAVLVLGFFVLFVLNDRQLVTPCGRLLKSLLFLETALLAFWLGFPAWLNLWFCTVAWGAASAAGRLLSWLRTRSKWIVLLGVAVILVDFCVHRVVPDARPLWRGVERDISEAWEVSFIATAFLLWLIYLAYQARKRLVVQAFADHTGDGALKAGVAGIDGRLRNELARISDVYRVIDEARPRAYQFVGVDADVQDVGDILKEAAGPSSSFQVFGMQIPANFLFSLLGRLVKGPRITGSVEGYGQDLALTAELSGGGFRGNWRVHPGDIDRESAGLSGEELLRALTKQLAYRIATDMTNIGSSSWRAVRSFTRGLRQYRETQNTEKDRDLKLRQAEKHLFEAAQDDKDFASCHYNLGIVYTRLGELGSAEAAFRVALRKAPDNYEACYALAEVHVELKEYEEALQLCEIAIRIDPKDARGWDLKSYVLREIEQKRCNHPWALPEKHEVWEEVLKPRRIAAALAWRRLCWALLAAPPPVLQRRRDTAVLCTRNLAVVLGRSGHIKPSARAFRQALRLSPYNQDLSFSLGKTLYWEPDWPRAAEVLENTLGEALTPQSRGYRLAMLVRIQTQPRTGIWKAERRVRERRSPGSATANRHAGERRKGERRKGTLRKLLDHVASAAAAAEPDALEDLRHVTNDCLERPKTEEKSFPGLRERSRRFQSLCELAEAAEWPVRNLKFAYFALAELGLGADGTGAGELKLFRRTRSFLLYLCPPRSEASRSREELEELRTNLESQWGKKVEPSPDDLDLDRLVECLMRSEPPGPCEGLQILFRDEPAKPDADVAAALQRFLDKVKALRQAAPRGASDKIEHQTERLLQECRGDIFLVLQWACGQTEVAIGRMCLGVGAAHPRRRELANSAREAIKAAIQRLERLDFQQPREQGLYSLWAQACLEAAEASGEPQERASLLKEALQHGQFAVGLNPQGVDARLVLVRIYTVLGDYQQAKEESDVCRATCLAHDPEREPEILRSVGAAFRVWMRSAESAQSRENVVQEAVVFFTRALRLIECRAFKKEKATEQIQSHAWAHYWLGRFYCEMGEYQIGIPHQKVGCELGFKPLEVRVHLAWAYLLARGYEDAEQAFRDALAEAERQRSNPRFSGVADEKDGGDRTLDDLLTDLYLGWGFLAIERDADLNSAMERMHRARKLISPGLEATRQRALHAAVQEGLARIHFKQGDLAECQKIANESLLQMRRCGTYCCLARARLAQAGLDDPLKAALEARVFARRALELDVRKRYRREIREILLKVRKTESAYRRSAQWIP